MHLNSDSKMYSLKKKKKKKKKLEYRRKHRRDMCSTEHGHFPERMQDFEDKIDKGRSMYLNSGSRICSLKKKKKNNNNKSLEYRITK